MTTKEYTRSILAQRQIYRDNDKELIIKVLTDNGVITNEVEAEAFRAMPFDLWDIRRNRQKIQEEGEYLPSESVQRARKHREVKERQLYSKPSGYYDYSSGVARWISK